MIQKISATIQNRKDKLKERTVVCCVMYSVKERNIKDNRSIASMYFM